MRDFNYTCLNTNYIHCVDEKERYNLYVLLNACKSKHSVLKVIAMGREIKPDEGKVNNLPACLINKIIPKRIKCNVVHEYAEYLNINKLGNVVTISK